MAWTYDGAPDTTTAAGRRDAVRLYIGDTDSTMSPTMSDAEIAFFLLQNGNAILAASVDAIRSLLAKWSVIPTTSVVGVGSVNAGDVCVRLQEAMLILQADAAKGASPVFGGQSIAANRRLNALTDVPQPTFLRDQDGYPGVRTSP
jgi:hypothetical protein